MLQSTNSRTSHVFILPRPAADQGKQLYQQPATLSDAMTIMAHFDARAYERYYAGSPCLDHLLTLSKLNVLRAFLENMRTLGLGMQQVEDDDAISPFNHNVNVTSTDPEPGDYDYGRTLSLPTSLYPSVIQRSATHHPWLDCFPLPRMRDNLINAAAADEQLFNDCDLCGDMMDPADEDVGVLVWGDPWIPQNWEVSQLFVQKWSWVIKGCPEILESSNRWRARRGLKRLAI